MASRKGLSMNAIISILFARTVVVSVAAVSAAFLEKAQAIVASVGGTLEVHPTLPEDADELPVVTVGDGDKWLAAVQAVVNEVVLREQQVSGCTFAAAEACVKAQSAVRGYLQGLRAKPRATWTVGEWTQLEALDERAVSLGAHSVLDF